MKLDIWPVSIAAGLLLVVLVNGAFLWVALKNAPIVDSSYTNASHR